MLSHKILGQGQLIMILHGLFGCSDNWQTFAKTLSISHQVILADLRNHGENKHKPTMDLEVMAEDVLELLESLNSSNILLIGHSLGGKVAMTLAQNKKSYRYISRLMILDIAPRSYNISSKDNLFKSLQSIDLRTLVHRKDAEIILQNFEIELKERQFLLKNLIRNTCQPMTTTYKWKCNLNVIINSYDTLVRAIDISMPISIPTTFVKGNLSNYMQHNDIEMIHQLCQNVRIITIENAGHWLHIDSPIALNNIIINF